MLSTAGQADAFVADPRGLGKKDGVFTDKPST